MKIGLLKETKTPVDNRVALTPDQVKELAARYPHVTFKAQASDVRAYSDDEYRAAGVEVADNVDDCDLILGIKEAEIDTLQPERHYMFFGHIAKKQAYNIPLFKRLIDQRITFSDYEYLVGDDGIRLVAFGWYAGVVGVYYTLRGWGLKKGSYDLPRPHLHFSMEELIGNLRQAKIGGVKIVVTGSGRVSQGAQHVLREIGAREVSPADFMTEEAEGEILYCVLPVEEMVAPNDPGKAFDFHDFCARPEAYHETFSKYATAADILLSCHYWTVGQPVYLTKEALRSPDCRLRMIGDVTCDIQGSIKSTLRSSTHDAPYYDYNPVTEVEEAPFSADSNITVMAVDTCPNALPRVTSQYFGEQLIKYVLTDLLDHESDRSVVLDRATILRDGKLTEGFGYLDGYVAGF